MTPDKLSNLLSRTIPSLRRLALCYTHNPEDAEDLLQDTLLHIVERWGQYHDYNFGGWAYRILTHTYLNKMRKKIAVTYYDEITTHDYCDIEYNDTEAELQQLPLSFRETIELLVAGYGYEEIAGILHISTGTVKSRIHRARKKLRQHMAE